MKWLNVFKAGEYGEKGSYNVSKLDEMVKEFSIDQGVPITVDHEDKGVAYGWVKGIRRLGDKLQASWELVKEFEDVVKKGYTNGSLSK